MKRRGFEAFGRLGLVAVVVTVFSLAFLIWEGDYSWITGFLGAGLLFIAMTFGVVWQLHRKAMREKLAANPSRQAVVTLTDTDIKISSEAGASTLPWATFCEVWRFDDFWLLFLASNNFITIPTEGVPEEALELISKRLPQTCRQV